MSKITKVAAVLVAAVALSACGRAPMANSMNPSAMSAAAKAKLPSRSAAGLSEYVSNVGAWAFAHFDANKNGTISEAEAQSKRLPDNTFAAADLNHDGQASQEEFARFVATNVNTAAMSKLRTSLAATFTALDTNKDGVLQAAEVVPTQGVPAAKAGQFELLSVTSTAATAAEFAAADETKDGVLVRSEFEDLFVLVNKRMFGAAKK